MRFHNWGYHIVQISFFLCFGEVSATSSDFGSSVVLERFPRSEDQAHNI